MKKNDDLDGAWIMPGRQQGRQDLKGVQLITAVIAEGRKYRRQGDGAHRQLLSIGNQSEVLHLLTSIMVISEGRN